MNFCTNFDFKISLHQTANSHDLFYTLCKVDVMCAFPAALSVRQPPPSRPVSTVCSLCLHGHCGPADRLIRAIFLDSRPSALWQPREVGWVGGGREVQEGWDICVPVAESC